MQNHRKIILIWWGIVLMMGCSKKDSVPPPPNTSKISIANLVYSPTEINIRHATSTAIINGTIDFSNASEGVAQLRLTTSAGGDVTVTVAANNQANGTLNGAFQVTIPATPGNFTFQLWIIDGAGNSSNKLLGAVQTKIDDSASEWAIASQAYSLIKVIWAKDKFIGLGITGDILTSPDGFTWTNHNTGSTASFAGLCWSGSQLVVVGADGAVITSVDGITWANKSLNLPGIHFNTVVWSGNKYIAAGEDFNNHKAVIASSSDGNSWMMNSYAIAGGRINAIAWSGNQFMAVGQLSGAPMLLSSLNGIDWTNKSSLITGGTELNDIIWTGTKFATVGFGLTATSADGNGWNINANINWGPGSVVWSGNRFVAAGITGIFTSADGVSWNKVYDSAYPLRSIAWSGIEYAAVGFISAVILVSPYQ